MSELDQLDVKLVDQDELETSITNKANKVLLLKDAELDEKIVKGDKRVESTQRQIANLSARLHTRELK